MNEPTQRKLHVDEDWKARVQAEKEALAAQERQERTQRGEEPQSLPPASFPVMVSNLATQALMGLGQLPDPAGQRREVDMDLARYAIDMLGVLQEKTAGNLDPAERDMLANTLHELRMAYLDASRGAAPPPPPGDGSSEPSRGRIITP